MKIDRLVVFTALSWLGLWVHEIHRVPALLGFTPDGDLFMLVIAAGLAYWRNRSRGPAPAAALATYAAINLVGGFLSMLPLSWLPFQPEQTASHYLVHAVYALWQLPLLVFASAQLIRGGARRRNEALLPDRLPALPDALGGWASQRSSSSLSNREGR